MVWSFYNRLPWRALERGIKKEHRRPLFHVALVFTCPHETARGLLQGSLAGDAVGMPRTFLPLPPLCPTGPGRAERKLLSPPSLELFPPFSSGPPLPCHGSKSVSAQRSFQACMHCLSAPELLLFLVPPFALSVTARIGKLSLRCPQLWSAGCSYTPSVLLNLVDNC